MRYVRVYAGVEVWRCNKCGQTGTFARARIPTNIIPPRKLTPGTHRGMIRLRGTGN